VEGDEVNNVDFLIEGKAGFVLPSFKNCRYINISRGDKFGFCDIIGSISQNDDMTLDDWYNKRHQLKRQFTIRADTDIDAMKLNISNLNQL